MSDPAFAVFINGTYGVGKSSTLDRVGDLLAEARKPFSLMDVDWFHRSWPTAADDPDNVLTEAANISAVWANYRAAGPRQLIIAGAITDARDRARYEDALSVRIRPVRLDACPEEIEARLSRRYSDDQGPSRAWHLERHADLTRRLDESGLDELVISTSKITPRDVARRIVDHFELRRSAVLDRTMRSGMDDDDRTSTVDHR